MSNVCCPTDKGVPDVEYAATGNKYYITGPIDSKKGVLMIADIFGIDIDNSKRYMDHLAAEGFLVVAPNFFGRRCWPTSQWPPNYESEEWQSFFNYVINFDAHIGHAYEAAKLMRKLGVEKISSVGMCWGANISVRLAREKVVDAVLTPHPSLLTVESLKDYTGPLGILFSKDEPLQDEIREALKDYPSKCVCESYDQLDHGFLCGRYGYDENNKEQMKQLDAAEKSSIDFLKAVL
ncbi:hypothetical protein AGDE_03403 [Angomonas deanei]|uniref:Dienelactone hydrolase family, putative n=1 Tax=Angomonas deanei TaxID=59799 RepID=A0A7G2C250_9TRYP|nr:hypothetical protein AGDE_03403 [Angomonas deanei]CAD2213281.1 Dienelactone hydrolase family, putative [Angomonas deanei]|eukprot:EPY40525.1 hypothetical protein AGDE_03403 [Angomonas deanei]